MPEDIQFRYSGLAPVGKLKGKLNSPDCFENVY